MEDLITGVKAVIFDVDGTIALPGDRRKYVERKGRKKDFNAFHQAMGDDLPNTNVIEVLNMYRNLGYRILLCTGRPEKFRSKTIDWLHKVGIGMDQIELYMRPDSDIMKSDVVVKQEMWEVLKFLFDIKCVFDDRKQVVKMWRSVGLTCFQVAEGNF